MGSWPPVLSLPYVGNSESPYPKKHASDQGSGQLPCSSMLFRSCFPAQAPLLRTFFEVPQEPTEHHVPLCHQAPCPCRWQLPSLLLSPSRHGHYCPCPGPSEEPTLFSFFELEQGCGWPCGLPPEVLTLYFSIIFWRVPHLVCQTCPHICELSGKHRLGSNSNACIQTMKKYKWRRCESSWPWSHAVCVTRTGLSGEHSCCLPLEGWGEREGVRRRGASSAFRSHREMMCGLTADWGALGNISEGLSIFLFHDYYFFPKCEHFLENNEN